MPKNFDDVILPERRKSIRNIPIPEGRRRGEKVAFADGVKRGTRAKLMEESVEEAPRPVHHPRHHGSKRNVLFAGALATLILIFAVLSFFSGATLSYTPKFAKLTFNNDVYSASKTGEGKLLYSVVKLSGEKGITVPANGEEQVNKKASGVIIVYNDASAESQRLIENTRFEAPTGKIYRIATAITVPGKKAVGGVSQPGSVEVTVYADQAGATYNTGLTDFTLPGLKGTPRYTTVYARSKTDMTGGFVGVQPVVTADNLDKAKEELKKALSQELIGKAQAEVPADFLLSSSLSSVTFEDMAQTASQDKKSAIINLRGNLYGIMFKRSDLADTLAKSKLNTESGEPVDLLLPETLQVSFAGTPPTDILPSSDISIKVSGSATVFWQTDEMALKSDLVGRHKRDLSSVLKNYPTIAKADATLRPFWKTSFPDEADKISIKKERIE